MTDFVVLADEVLWMMRSYKTDIENAASLQGNMRSTARVVQGASEPS